MANYIALIHKDAESIFGVTFPDFPGCTSAAETVDDLKDQAVEALAVHAETMLELGHEIPDPSGLDQVLADRQNQGAVAVLVVALDVPSRFVRVNITVPEKSLKKIDFAAKNMGLSRSAFLVQSAEKSIAH